MARSDGGGNMELLTESGTAPKNGKESWRKRMKLACIIFPMEWNLL